MTKKTWMNQSEYAKHLGISQQRVAKMLQRGIISNGVVKFRRGSKVGFKIDPKKADIDYEQNRHLQNQPKKKLKGKPATPKEKPPTRRGPKTPPTEAEKQQVIDKAGVTEFGSLTDAQKFKETYAGALKKLEYEKESGDLITAESVKRDAERVARIVKEKVTSWPGRTAPIIASITDVFEVEQALKKESDQLLTEISKEVLK